MSYNVYGESGIISVHFAEFQVIFGNHNFQNLFSNRYLALLAFVQHQVMNWLNNNLDSDGSESSDSTDSTPDETSQPSRSDDGQLYLCAICEKSTTSPIYNKEQCCLQCPYCKRSWCLKSSSHDTECRKLDLIPKRYVELKFSELNRRRYGHRQTRHTLSWIGTNILGNLGNVEDTLHQINLARNVDEPTVESLRAQQRFGITHSNTKSYRATHPVIIGSLPTLNTDDAHHQRLLQRHKSCPICQLDFIGTPSESDCESDELDELNHLLLSDDEHSNNEQMRVMGLKQDIFQQMNQSRIRSNKMHESTEATDKLEDTSKCSNQSNVVVVYGQNADDQGKSGGNTMESPVIAEWKQDDHGNEDIDDQQHEMKLESDNVRVSHRSNGNYGMGVLRNVTLVTTEKEDKNKTNEKDEEVSVKDGIVRLWCGHLFHNECVVPWLSKQNTCPLCRFELPSNNPDYELQKRMETYNGNVLQVMST